VDIALFPTRSQNPNQYNRWNRWTLTNVPVGGKGTAGSIQENDSSESVKYRSHLPQQVPLLPCLGKDDQYSNEPIVSRHFHPRI
ncbi:MAG: hypothetical protein AAFP89_26520, partial [Bacteroidota bacterium]